MLFHNPTDRSLRFTVANKNYEVPAGAEVEIPETLAYVVQARGLALASGPAPGGARGQATVRGTLPAAVVALLHELPPQVRVGFEDAWASADAPVRARLLEELSARVAAHAAHAERTEGPGEDVPAQEAPEISDEVDLGSLDEAIDKAAVTAGRPPSKVRANRTRT